MAMTMKKLNFKIALLAIFVVFGMAASASEDVVGSKTDRWTKLKPNLFTLQYAGGIGMFSVGIGWDYGSSDQWETHALVGFTPKRYDYHTYWTVTLREIYNPWCVGIDRHWSIKPLSVNFAINSILHNDFWTKEPDRYPHGYYGFSSRLRFHLGVGQRVVYNFPKNRKYLGSSVSAYYEVSTCDLYVRQKFLSKSIPMKDILSLAVGVIWTL